MKTSQTFRIFGSLLVVGAMAVSFQNCGSQSGHFADVGAQNEAAAQAAFFDYPFTAKPTIYGDVTASILSDKTATGGLLTLQIVTTVRSVASLTASTPFVVQVQSSNGATLCPNLSGTATPTTTTFTSNCVTTQATAHVNLTLTVGTGSAMQVIKRSL